MNSIGKTWNIMDCNGTIHYKTWWESTNDIGTERNWIDIHMKVLIRNVMGSDESDRNSLERNGSQRNNNIWYSMGFFIKKRHRTGQGTMGRTGHHGILREATQNYRTGSFKKNFLWHGMIGRDGVVQDGTENCNNQHNRLLKEVTWRMVKLSAVGRCPFEPPD